MNKPASQVNRSIVHSTSSMNLFIVQSSGMPLCKRFTRYCRFQRQKPFAAKQGNCVNTIEEKLLIRHQHSMTLHHRFSLYRYKTSYNASHDYVRKKAATKLQNLMRKRRTVLPPNGHTSSNSKSNFEHSAASVPLTVLRSLAEANVGRCQYVASNDSVNTYSIESQNTSDCISWPQCKREKLPTKEDLDKELDEYMAEIREKMR